MWAIGGSEHGLGSQPAPHFTLFDRPYQGVLSAGETVGYCYYNNTVLYLFDLPGFDCVGTYFDRRAPAGLGGAHLQPSAAGLEAEARTFAMQCPTTTGWSQAVAPLTADHPACGADSCPSGQAFTCGQGCLVTRPPASCVAHSEPVRPCAQPAEATGSLPAHERLFQARQVPHCAPAKLARHILRQEALLLGMEALCVHASSAPACGRPGGPSGRQRRHGCTCRPAPQRWGMRRGYRPRTWTGDPLIMASVASVTSHLRSGHSQSLREMVQTPRFRSCAVA